MFNLFSRKQSLVKSELFSGFTDCHSHILPCVDDGVQSVEKAIEILAYYESIGIKRVIFTPHIMENFPDNSVESLRSRFAKFKSQYEGSIELDIAAEYMLDSGFYEHLHSGEMLTLKDNHLLVETSYISSPINFDTMLKDIKSKGYLTVLAHPERYRYMKVQDLCSIKSNGLLFQLNLLSLSGYYGKQVKGRALYLLDHGMYNIIGSDLHNLELFQKQINCISLKSKQIDRLQEIKENNICVLNK